MEMGVVVETDRPVTHGKGLAAPVNNDDVAELTRLRGVVAELESQIAAFQQALVERDGMIKTLRGDLAAAEELLKTYSAAAEAKATSDEAVRLAAGPVATPTVGLPVVAPPWKAAG
jgi:hypothetical protein